MKKHISMLLVFALLIGVFAMTLTGCNRAEEAPATEAATEAATQAATQAATEEAAVEEVKYMRTLLQQKNETVSAFNPTFKSANNNVIYLIWETLISYDVDAGEYYGVLADSWEMAPDGLSYTVKLKEDATWSDGEPVTAQDVVFTYSFALSGGGTASSKLSQLEGYQDVLDGKADTISGIVAQDEHTVVFNFTAPNYLFEETMAHLTYSILPAHLFEGMTTADALVADYWVAPVGSGAYKVNEAAWPDYVTLTARDDWHGGIAGIKDIMLVQTTKEAEVAGLMSGELHFIRGMEQAATDTAKAENPALKSEVVDAAYVRYLQFNLSDTGREDLQNARIRQALSMIIDKQMLVDYMGVQTTVATTNNASDYNTDIPRWERNVEKGIEILNEEGFDFSKEIKIYTDYTDQLTVDLLDILVANFAEAGITATYTNGGDDVVTLIYETRDWDLFYGGSMGRGVGAYGIYTDNPTYYDKWYNESLLEYRHERYQVLFDQYASTPDKAGRDAIVDQVQVNAMEDMFTIPLYFRNTIWVYDEALQGLDMWGTEFDEITRQDPTQWSFAG